MSPVAIRARSLFDAVGDTLLRDHAVLVDGDVIAEIGPGERLVAKADRVIEMGDATVLPGFVDAHTHVSIRPGEGDQHGQLRLPVAEQAFRAVANLRRMVASGVTTARVMGEREGIDHAAKRLITSGELVGPRLFVSGPALSATHGHGAALGVADGVEGVRLAVRRALRDGADHIKFFMTGGVSSTGSGLFDHHYRREEVRAIVEESHRVGKRVAVHAHGGPGVSVCVEEGVDSIEHGSLLTDENVELMRARGTWLVLTKSIAHHPDGIERGDAGSGEVLAKLREARAADEASFDRVRAAGLRYALGTDSMHGLFGHEISWLIDRGVDPASAFRAATRHGAEVIGIEDEAGTLEPGKRADLVVLAGDAFEHPARATTSVRLVMKAGVVVHRNG